MTKKSNPLLYNFYLISTQLYNPTIGRQPFWSEKRNSTVHQAAFQPPTGEPVCSGLLGDRRSCLYDFNRMKTIINIYYNFPPVLLLFLLLSPKNCTIIFVTRTRVVVYLELQINSYWYLLFKVFFFFTSALNSFITLVKPAPFFLILYIFVHLLN